MRAPRLLPGGLGLRLAFGGTFTQLAWMTITFVLAMAAGMVRCTDLDDVFGRGQVETHGGVIISVEETSISEDKRILRVRFEVPGHEPPIVGASYTKDPDVQPGDEVVVEVPVEQREHARIAGMRRKPFDALGTFVMLGLWVPLIPAFVALRGRRGALDRHLLTHGRLARGKLVRREETIVTINEKRVIKLAFDFEDEGGRHHRALARSHKPETLEDETEEPLIYDPARPGNARLLDALPGRPRLDASGAWIVSPGRAPAWTLLMLPVIALAELMLVIVLAATG